MKKKFRSITAAAMAFAVCLSMAGCGSSGTKTEADIERELETLNEENLEERLMALDGAEKTEQESTAAPEQAEIVPTDEIIAEKIFSDKIQIGSKVYTFPVTVSELLENGELKLNGSNPDGLVRAGESEYIKIKGTGVEFGINATNNTNDMTELKNCTIHPGANAISTGKSKNIFYSGGLRRGMPYTEFIELFGEPDYIEKNYDIYRYYDAPYTKKGSSLPMFSATGYVLSVNMDMDNGCVSGYSVSIGNRSNEYEENDVTFYYGDKYYWNAPGDLAFDNIMMIEAEGKNYLIEPDHGFRLNEGSLNSKYFPDEMTEAALTDILDTKSADVKYCVVNDDGTANAITLNDLGYYTGYFYSGDFMAEIVFWVKNTDKDDEGEIPEAAKDQAYNILIEVLKRGVVYEAAE